MSSSAWACARNSRIESSRVRRCVKLVTLSGMPSRESVPVADDQPGCGLGSLREARSASIRMFLPIRKAHARKPTPRSSKPAKLFRPRSQTSWTRSCGSRRARKGARIRSSAQAYSAGATSAKSASKRAPSGGRWRSGSAGPCRSALSMPPSRSPQPADRT